MTADELTDAQNACLEAAQEAAADRDRSGVVSAGDVVAHVARAIARGETATIAHPISKAHAGRALRQLCDWGILRREPRSSLGWGRGWEAVYYALKEGLLSDYEAQT